MGDAKQDVVLECKNCLKRGSTIYTRSLPTTTALCALVTSTGFITYHMMVLIYEWLAGDITAESGSLILICCAAVLLAAITIGGAAYIIGDFKRRDYWLFMDKFGRVHCDTVSPQYHKGRYYWQPLGSDIHLLEQDQTLSSEQLVITSTLIRWRVGGFSRSRGEIYHYQFTTGQWVFDGDNRITAFILPTRNPLTWQGSSITLKNIKHRNTVTVPLLSFLRFTEEHNDKLNGWLSHNELLERVAECLRINTKNKTATKNYVALGRFLVKMRELASSWPEHSEYARAMRKETDSFLEVMPTEDVKAWRAWADQFPGNIPSFDRVPTDPLPEKHLAPEDAMLKAYDDATAKKAAEPQAQS